MFIQYFVKLSLRKSVLFKLTTKILIIFLYLLYAHYIYLASPKYVIFKCLFNNYLFVMCSFYSTIDLLFFFYFILLFA